MSFNNRLRLFKQIYNLKKLIEHNKRIAHILTAGGLCSEDSPFYEEANKIEYDNHLLELKLFMLELQYKTRRDMRDWE